MEFTVHEAKTHFSKLLAAVAEGQEVIITSGRARKHVARVMPVVLEGSKRLGFAKDWPELGPEFFEPLPDDELRLWNGEGD
jgi:prevent-host-death family protein